MTDARSRFEQDYRTTRYVARVGGEVIVIRIGEPTPALDDLLRREGVTRWAYITAWNPASEPTSATENDERQAKLQQSLAGWRIFEGEGVPADDSGWKPEASFLVLGMDEAEAVRLGRAWGQNAIVTGRWGEAARLAWCMAV